jgi:hypothetical protein
MVGKSKIKIKDHLSMGEINKFVNNLKIEINLYKSLLFLKSVKQRTLISHAADFIGIN